jgi:hypothetical protein
MLTGHMIVFAGAYPDGVRASTSEQAYLQGKQTESKDCRQRSIKKPTIL